MMIGRLGRLYLGICVATATLAGCSGSQPPIVAPGMMSPRATLPVTERAPLPFLSDSYRGTPATEKIIYAFAGSPDGAAPEGGLILVRGDLYGTTYAGGTFSGARFSASPFLAKRKPFIASARSVTERVHRGASSRSTAHSTERRTTAAKLEMGAVFELTPSGDEKVIHSFAGAPDGAFPLAGLVDVGGALYGTTWGGGTNASKYQAGVRFIASRLPARTVIHSFGASGDGRNAAASLVEVKDKLYGTTQFGGAAGRGTVFVTNLSGREKVIHSFSGSPDGDLPIANLVEAKGTLYGTTYSGGSYTSNCRQNSYVEGCGTVFSIKPWGKEKVIYNFDGGSVGQNPLDAPLIAVGGRLYGTANGGKDGFGIVFSLKPSGRFTILHNFRGTLDGSGPYGGLLNVNGTLYGTTGGGGSGCGSYGGCGTVYSISPVR